MNLSANLSISSCSENHSNLSPNQLFQQLPSELQGMVAAYMGFADVDSLENTKARYYAYGLLRERICSLPIGSFTRHCLDEVEKEQSTTIPSINKIQMAISKSQTWILTRRVCPKKAAYKLPFDPHRRIETYSFDQLDQFHRSVSLDLDEKLILFFQEHKKMFERGLYIWDCRSLEEILARNGPIIERAAAIREWIRELSHHRVALDWEQLNYIPPEILRFSNLPFAGFTISPWSNVIEFCSLVKQGNIAGLEVLLSMVLELGQPRLWKFLRDKGDIPSWKIDEEVEHLQQLATRDFWKEVFLKAVQSENLDLVQFSYTKGGIDRQLSAFADAFAKAGEKGSLEIINFLHDCILHPQVEYTYWDLLFQLISGAKKGGRSELVIDQLEIDISARRHAVSLALLRDTEEGYKRASQLVREERISEDVRIKAMEISTRQGKYIECLFPVFAMTRREMQGLLYAAIEGLNEPIFNKFSNYFRSDLTCADRVDVLKRAVSNYLGNDQLEIAFEWVAQLDRRPEERFDSAFEEIDDPRRKEWLQIFKCKPSIFSVRSTLERIAVFFNEWMELLEGESVSKEMWFLLEEHLSGKELGLLLLHLAYKNSFKTIQNSKEVWNQIPRKMMRHLKYQIFTAPNHLLDRINQTARRDLLSSL